MGCGAAKEEQSTTAVAAPPESLYSSAPCVTGGVAATTADAEERPSRSNSSCVVAVASTSPTVEMPSGTPSSCAVSESSSATVRNHSHDVAAQPRKVSLADAPREGNGCVGNHVSYPAAMIVRRSGSHMCCKMVMEGNQSGNFSPHAVTSQRSSLTAPVPPAYSSRSSSVITQDSAVAEPCVPVDSDPLSGTKCMTSAVVKVSSPLFRQRSLSSPRTGRRSSVSFEADIVTAEAVLDEASATFSASSHVVSLAPPTVDSLHRQSLR